MDGFPEKKIWTPARQGTGTLYNRGRGFPFFYLQFAVGVAESREEAYLRLYPPKQKKKKKKESEPARVCSMAACFCMVDFRVGFLAPERRAYTSEATQPPPRRLSRPLPRRIG